MPKVAPRQHNCAREQHQCKVSGVRDWSDWSSLKVSCQISPRAAPQQHLAVETQAPSPVDVPRIQGGQSLLVGSGLLEPRGASTKRLLDAGGARC